MTETKQPQIEQLIIHEIPHNSGFLVYSLVMMVLLSISVLLPLLPNDFWPYLRIGEEILKNRSIPTTEFMTYTQFGHPAVYLFWLPSLIFLGLYNLGGILLIEIISALCIGGFYTFLWLAMRELRANPLIAGIILFITALIGVNDWSTRPQIFTLPLFGLALLLVIKWQKLDNRFLWLLPVISMIWANFHASFIVLFFILIPALLIGKGNRKRLLLITLFSLFSTLINPYGIGLWSNLFAMVHNTSIINFSLEWQPPTNSGWQANLFFGILLLIPVLTAFSKPRIYLLYWIWFLGFGWMALSAVRYIAWFLPFEAILLIMLLNPIISRSQKRFNFFTNRKINLVIGIALLLLPISLLPGIRGLWWNQAPPLYNERTPVNATNWLKQNSQLPGELWSDFSYSTYLTYALPERKLFMTNRFEDFPAQQLSDNRRIDEATYDWQTILDKYKVNLIMASTTSEPNLIQAALSSPNWREVYRDDQTVIFIRNIRVGYEPIV